MPEEKKDAHPDDEIDEMPDPTGAPCGDIFGTPPVTHVTDADADVVGDQQDA
jgi:hypothetical protein